MNFFCLSASSKIIGKTGIVRSLAEHGISVQYDGFENPLRINPEALVRLSSFSMGQPIQIKDDPDTISMISQQRGNPTARDVQKFINMTIMPL